MFTGTNNNETEYTSKTQLNRVERCNFPRPICNGILDLALSGTQTGRQICSSGIFECSEVCDGLAQNTLCP